ncbi:MAG: ABC transporter permease [Ancalomicrobiaceae bacterium]|nr:ABC transporter permease [Ancalomicrobiaceae bacterium]
MTRLEQSTTQASRFAVLSSLISGWELALVVALFAVLGGFAVGAPGFFDGIGGLLQITQYFLPFGLVAMGLSIVILTGGIDLSVGATASLSALVMAQLWAMFGLNIWLAAAVALVLGGLLGAINGLIVTRLRTEPLIATLATSFIYGSIATAVGGDNPPSGFPDSFNALGIGTVDPTGLIPWQLVLFAVVATATGLLMGRTSFGRKVVMIGYNSGTAYYSGIPVQRVLLSSYVLSGLTAALAGVVLAAYYSAARSSMGDPLLLSTLTMVVLGGVSIFGGEGTITGVILAVLVLGFLRQGLLIAGYSDMVTTMVTGVILLGSIAVKNTLSTRRNLLRARLRRWRTPAHSPQTNPTVK